MSWQRIQVHNQGKGRSQKGILLQERRKGMFGLESTMLEMLIVGMAILAIPVTAFVCFARILTRKS
jgi:hypothetical protein